MDVSMGPVVLSAIVTALWIGTANKAWQLWTAPEDLALRAVTACLACVAAMFSLSLPPVRAALDQADTGLRILAVNLGTMTTAYLLLAFFTYSVHGPVKRRGVRLQAVPLVVAMAVATGAWYVAPAEVRVAPADPANGSDVHATVFVLAVLGYMAYAHALTLRWSVAYARAARLARLRRGLVVVCVALAAFLCAEVTKSALAVAQSLTDLGPGARGLNGAYLGFVALGTLSFVVGISYPAVVGMVAAVPVWRRHRRYYRELQPLWAALNRAFPHLALLRLSSNSWRERFGLPSTHRRFYRRVIEIRDGLVQLAPYYDRTAGERAAASARAGDTGPEVEDAMRASLIANALQAKAADAPVADGHPVPVPGGPDLDSDARSLTRIARRIAPLLAEPPTAARGR